MVNAEQPLPPNPAPLQPASTTPVIVKEHWLGLVLLGLGLGPLSVIISIILFPLLSLTVGIVLALIFRSAEPYIIIAVPFFLTAFGVSLILNIWDVVSPKTIAFSSLAILWSSVYIAMSIAEHYAGHDARIPAAILVGLVGGQVLPFFVGLHEHEWSISLSSKSIAGIGVVFAAAAIGTGIIV